MVTQVCRQRMHRSSQVKEGFNLCEQRCSVGHALASHVRGQRKFNPWAGKPWGSQRSWHSEPIRLYRLVLGVHDVQQFLPSLIAQPTAITTNHRGDYLFGHSLPTTIPGKLLRHPRNLVTVEHFSSVDPVHRGNSLSVSSPPQPSLPQGLPWSTESS
jgi:hypothetical protein